MRGCALLLALLVVSAGCSAGGSTRPAVPATAPANATRPAAYATPRAPSAAVPHAPSFTTPPAPAATSAGSRRALTAAPHAAFFAGEAPLSNGVFYLALPNGNPFGYYSYLADPAYVFHFDLGYEYVADANDAQGGVYLYDFASGHWWYTSRTMPFPYVYDFTLNAFLYYFPDSAKPGHYSTNPRYFYNFGTSQIITLPAVGVARYVHSVTVSPTQPYPPLGTPATIPVTVTARDLSGVPIVSPDRYANPVTVIDKDPSGHTTLSAAVVSSPADKAMLHYDGKYFPFTGLTADWLDPTGSTYQPFTQIATGVPTVETSVGTDRVVKSLTVGGDGMLWFGDQLTSSIGRSANGAAPVYFPMTGGWGPMKLVTAQDGSVWFSAFGFGSVVTPYTGVGRIALDGTYGPMRVTSSPYNNELVAASDGNMYLNQLRSLTRITPTGTVTDIPVPYLGSPLHTDTLAAGPDGALWVTGLGTLFRLDLGTGIVTNTPFPTPSDSGRPIEPGILAALPDRRLYFDDKGGAIYYTTPPSTTATFLASGTNVPYQGSALGETSMALAGDGTLWFTSFFTTQDAHPVFGHVVGNAVQMLVGQAGLAHRNVNGEAVPASSLVLGPDGHLWYARSDVLGKLLP